MVGVNADAPAPEGVIPMLNGGGEGLEIAVPAVEVAGALCCSACRLQSGHASRERMGDVHYTKAMVPIPPPHKAKLPE